MMATFNCGVRSEHEMDVKNTLHACTDRMCKTFPMEPACVSGHGMDLETTETSG